MVCFIIGNGGTNTWARFEPLTGPYLHVGTVYHLATVYDGSNIMTLYIDGVELGSGPVGPAYPSSLQITEIGRSPHTQQRFDGLIDDVRIYDYALTPEQILSDMGNSTVVPLSNDAAKANLYEDPALQVIDFKDFSVLANDWLVDNLSP